MLPGFRFLFSAIILAMSVMIFGLGAASLMRAAHEQIASNPSRRPPPEAVFAQQNENAMPALALLRVEAPAAEKPSDTAPVASVPQEQSKLVTAPAEPENIAASEPVVSAPAEAAKPDEPASENSPPDQPAVAGIEEPVAAPAAPDLAKIALAETVVPLSTRTLPPPVSETADAPAPPAAAIPSAKTAELTGSAVTVEKTVESKKASSTRSARNVVRKRQRAERRRRARFAHIVRRPAPRQPLDPFGQPAFAIR